MTGGAGMTEIRPGYKQTEVGVIPEDWEIKQLGDLGYIFGGLSNKTKKDFGVGNSRYIPFMNVIYNTTIDTNDLEFVNVGDGENQNKVDKGDLFFNGSSETPEEVGMCAVLLEELENTYLNSFCFGFRLYDLDAINGLFLACFFRSNAGRSLLYSLAQGATRYNLSKTSLLKVKFPIPPISEQIAIVNTLSDLDAEIVALDALQSKKRAIKQAAMQQLLTGQTRLPGFSGEWEIKPLGELGFTFGGLSNKTKSDFGVGTSRYIPFMNVIYNTIIDTNDLEFVNVGDGENQNKVNKGDLFFNGSSETPEEVGMCAVLLEELENTYLNSFCFGFRLYDLDAINGLFLAYFFRSNAGRSLLYSLAQGATRYNLSKTSLLKVKFPIPSISEQIAVVNILSDMDAEISALEAQRAKVQALKQGMLQELLTGRTRLV